MLVNGNKKHGSRMEIYNKLNDEWNSLYYCGRDDLIFLPGKDFCKSPEQLQEYYKEALS